MIDSAAAFFMLRLPKTIGNRICQHFIWDVYLFIFKLIIPIPSQLVFDQLVVWFIKIDKFSLKFEQARFVSLYWNIFKVKYLMGSFKLLLHIKTYLLFDTLVVVLSVSLLVMLVTSKLIVLLILDIVLALQEGKKYIHLLLISMVKEILKIRIIIFPIEAMSVDW